MVQSVSFLNEVLSETTQRDMLTFQETKDPQDPGGGTMPYFGSIPDYGFEGPGVKLNGVRPDSPAEKALLQRGDIIIKMDQTEIADIYVYTEVLKQHKPGDIIQISYLRAGEVLLTQATLEERK